MNTIAANSTKYTSEKIIIQSKILSVFTRSNTMQVHKFFLEKLLLRKTCSIHVSDLHFATVMFPYIYKEIENGTIVKTILERIHKKQKEQQNYRAYQIIHYCRITKSKKIYTSKDVVHYTEQQKKQRRNNRCNEQLPYSYMFPFLFIQPQAQNSNTNSKYYL